MDENAVVEAIRSHLEATGHKIHDWCKTTEHGIDVVAEMIDTGQRVLVEAKGATSSRNGSARFGKPFSPSQIFDRVAKGVFTCMQLRTQVTDARVILAVPDTPLFKRLIASTSSSLQALRIDVWFAHSHHLGNL